MADIFLTVAKQSFKPEVMKRKIIAPILLSLGLMAAWVSAQSPQPAEGTVKQAVRKVPGIQFREVAKQVAPNVYEIDPARLYGKRLDIGEPMAIEWAICIGKYNTTTETCEGVYIHFGKD